MRRLALTLIAATLGIVIAGCAQASAKGVVLCKVNKDPCPAGSIAGNEFYGFVETGATKVATHITITLPKAVTTTCSPGKFVTHFEEAIKTPRLGEANVVFFFGCSAGCEVEAENRPYGASLEASGGGNGVLAVNGFRLHVYCGATYDCFYGKAKLEATVKGGEPASMTILTNLEKQTPSTAACPTTASYDAVYQENNYPSAYVSHQ
jgi:uncharacterized protein with FMN-binding domain